MCAPHVKKNKKTLKRHFFLETTWENQSPYSAEDYIIYRFPPFIISFSLSLPLYVMYVISAADEARIMFRYKEYSRAVGIEQGLNFSFDVRSQTVSFFFLGSTILPLSPFAEPSIGSSNSFLQVACCDVDALDFFLNYDHGTTHEFWSS